ncbi:MAG: hypothetical protein U1D69_07980 [Polynucleobacter sp.]|nr:hypothetical protein [Polynucleobacter sp.]
MGIALLEVNPRRRALLIAVGSLPVACIPAQPYPSATPVAPPLPTPTIRPPQVGQEWVYAVRNVFNQELVDILTERVVAVGDQVRIARSGQKAGPLPDEIQSPWGDIVQDPHWNPPQRFLKAVPLWPQQLQAGWSGFYRTRYEVLGSPDFDYYWGLNINAIGWEQIKTPAGEFVVLKYVNEAPFFTSNDFARVANVREETVWLSPEIGRWVTRRSSGRYLWAGMTWASALWEDWYEWELISWK